MKTGIRVGSVRSGGGAGFCFVLASFGSERASWAARISGMPARTCCSYCRRYCWVCSGVWFRFNLFGNSGN